MQSRMHMRATTNPNKVADLGSVSSQSERTSVKPLIFKSLEVPAQGNGKRAGKVANSGQAWGATNLNLPESLKPKLELSLSLPGGEPTLRPSLDSARERSPAVHGVSDILTGSIPLSRALVRSRPPRAKLPALDQKGPR